MKSGLLAAVAVGGLLLAAPASAQGVKIGILNDQSGVYADYGGKWSFEAAKMAVEDFGGEVLGHKIEIISADHQNKPDLGSAIARRWYDVENVDMITELTTSSVALADSRAFEGEEENRHRGGRGDVASHRRRLPALRISLGLRYACAGVRHRWLVGGSRRR